MVIIVLNVLIVTIKEYVLMVNLEMEDVYVILDILVKLPTENSAIEYRCTPWMSPRRLNLMNIDPVFPKTKITKI